MSVLLERSMGDRNKEKVEIYPLFQKGATPQPPPPKKRASTDNLKVTEDPIIPEYSEKSLPKRRGQKAKPNPIDVPVHDSSLLPTQNGTKQGELLEVDPNNGRRKRRKISSDAGEPLLKHHEPFSGSTIPSGGKPSDSTQLTSSSIINTAPDLATVQTSRVDLLHMHDVNSVGNSSLAGTEPLPLIQETDHDLPGSPGAGMDHPPRKVLRLNSKTGTIGSPPAKKFPPTAITTGKKPTSRRGQLKSKMVILHYGDGQALSSTIGEKIDLVLNGILTILPVEKTEPAKVVKRSPPKPPKSTHPFFLGKVAVKDPSPTKSTNCSTSVIDLTGPSKSNSQIRTQVSSYSKPHSPGKTPVSFMGFGTSAKITKFPGAVEPSWPCKDMVHVRGLPLESGATQRPITTAPGLVTKGKKGKYQAVRIERSENILGTLAKELCISNVVDSIREVNPDEFLPRPDCLRVPKKHLESGLDVQGRVRKELHTRVPASSEVLSEDETQQPTKSRVLVHPAILKTYHLVSESLSAFDKGVCETLPWTQKYAPKFASDVLQTGRNVPILKSWLQSLTVKAVEAGPGNDNESASRKPPGGKSELDGKRKRKTKKLDDFMISSGDEADEMEEISDDEVESASPGSQSQMRTVYRRGDPTKDTGRAVVISGPHGCGKTAAVYAVAKELGFEVFELNPGTRRNGKDILDRVGDMAHNHQVQRVSGMAQADGPADENGRTIDEALANDLKSGRQGTMNSFFKSNTVAKPTAQPKTEMKPVRPSPIHPTQQTLVNRPNGQPKAQKQSLILIEEADILYKEDTQFWSTIQQLIRTSRRPVVITCNDEIPIPLGILPLHAIIRMRAPPLDLATDYMLLVAACEGHIIRREAVRALYHNRGMDMRAALTDLDYWCQFGVGDQKNGLSWYLRGPRAHDIDKNAKSIRVISEGTYEVGMGCLSQDILESQMHHLRIEEETLREACDGWNLDLGHWQEILDMDSWAQDTHRQLSIAGRGAALEAYEDFTETMSGADLCSRGLFSFDKQLEIDASLPELTVKSRDDFTLASRLLEAATTVDYKPLGKDISLWVKSRARNHLQVEQHVRMDAEVPIELSRPVEADFIRKVQSLSMASSLGITRRDFSNAFDPISYPEKPSFSNSDKMEISVFDRTTQIIAEDMAPYIRSIVDFDSQLQAEREKLSSLMSEGARKGKRVRTTRAAMSALEGGARSTAKRERYFGSLLNPYVVMKTGLQSWTEAARQEMRVGGSRRPSTAESKDATSENEEDELMHHK